MADDKIFTDSTKPAALVVQGKVTHYLTLQEAKIALQKMPPDQLRVVALRMEDGVFYTGEDIDKLHKGTTAPADMAAVEMLRSLAVRENWQSRFGSLAPPKGMPGDPTLKPIAEGFVIVLPSGEVIGSATVGEGRVHFDPPSSDVSPDGRAFPNAITSWANAAFDRWAERREKKSPTRVPGQM